jgi:hypothetical protein
VLAMGLLLPAAAFFWSQTFLYSLSPAAPVFIPVAEAHALEWLDANSEPGAIVLSRYDVGNALPAYADLTAFIGHGPETLDSKEKQILVDTVLDGERTDSERLAALHQTGAGYVVVSSAERVRLGAGVPGCELIYREEGWEVWKVSPL